MNKSTNFRFRSLGEDEIKKIHEYQNSELGFEISQFFDMDQDWIPCTEEAIKDKVKDIDKNDNNHVFAVWEETDLIGLAIIYSDWDPLCPVAYVFIWPEFRRRGHGKKLANIFLDKLFNNYHGHKVSVGTPSYYKPGLKFIQTLGFKPAGKMRRTSIHEGKYADWVCFDMLKTEFNDHQGRGV